MSVFLVWDLCVSGWGPRVFAVPRGLAEKLVREYCGDSGQCVFDVEEERVERLFPRWLRVPLKRVRYENGSYGILVTAVNDKPFGLVVVTKNYPPYPWAPRSSKVRVYVAVAEKTDEDIDLSKRFPGYLYAEDVVELKIRQVYRREGTWNVIEYHAEVHHTNGRVEHVKFDENRWS